MFRRPEPSYMAKPSSDPSHRRTASGRQTQQRQSAKLQRSTRAPETQNKQRVGFHRRQASGKIDSTLSGGRATRDVSTRCNRPDRAECRGVVCPGKATPVEGLTRAQQRQLSRVGDQLPTVIGQVIAKRVVPLAAGQVRREILGFVTALENAKVDPALLE